MALQLPKLKVDTSAGNLVANVDGQAKVDAAYEKHFGQNDPRVIAVVASGDVLSESALKVQAELSRSLSKIPAVSQVQGLVTLSFPKDLDALPPSDIFALAPEDQQAEDAEKELSRLLEKPIEALSMEERARRETAEREGVKVRSVAEIEQQRKEADAEYLEEIFQEMPKHAPPREVFRTIAAAERAAFPEGEKSLIDRLARNEDAKPHPSWAEEPNTEVLKRALARFAWVSPALVSRDRTLAPLIIELNEARAFDQKTRLLAVDAIRKTISRTQIPAGITVELGGVPVIHEAIEMKLKADRRLLNPLMGIVCLLILGLTFRWWPAVVAPISAVIITSVTVLGTMALLGQSLTILTNIITPLLLIVGLSDSVHLIGRYREELTRDSDRQAAGQKAVVAMMKACFLTSLTTAVGFASLATARTPELRSFGLIAAFGVMLAYFATVLFVPAFITLAAPPPPLSPDGLNRGPLERSVARLTHAVLARSKMVVMVSLVLAVVLSLAASRTRADARLLDAFEKEDPVHRVTTKLQDGLLGIRPLELWLESSEGTVLTPERVAQVDELKKRLQASDSVIAVSDFATPLREMRSYLTADKTASTSSLGDEKTALAYLRMVGSEKDAPVFERITPDAKHARVSVYLKDIGVQGSLNFIADMEKTARELFGPGITLRMTGEAYVGSKGRSWVLRDLLGGLVLALVSIFALLTLLFRSFRLGLAAIPPNVIPLLGTGAYMMARGIDLNITTVITFSIGIGLAVDNSIHVVARFLEERRNHSSVDVALVRAARGTGLAIVVTALSLALGFAVLLLSSFVSVRQFGELIVVTVVNSLVGALVIQPALLRMAVRRGKRKGARPA